MITKSGGSSRRRGGSSPHRDRLGGSGTLTIKGQRKYEGGDKDQVWLGRAYGAFERSFTLPELVDGERMTADLADGVLTIHVPKKPQAKPRRIQIGGGNGHKQLGQSNE